MTSAEESQQCWMASDFHAGLTSVIIPTHNRSDLLFEALASVQAQTYRPIEVLVVDDGSTDDTEAVVRDWIESTGLPDFIVQYFRQENQGAPAARNRGISMSKGEFIQFFDSDDLLHPLKIETQVAMLREHPECDFAWCGYVSFRGNQRPDTGRSTSSSEIRKSPAKIFETFPGTVWGNLFRRSVIIENGPWVTHLKKWQDLEYVSRIACSKPRLTVSREDQLYFFRIHEQGRIADLYKTSAGIDAGFESLRLITKTLDNTKNWNLHVGKCICQFYMGLALQAMKYGIREQVELAFEKALAIHTYPAFLRNLRILQCIYRVCGKYIAHNLMQTYSGIALRSAKSVNQV